MNEEQIIKKITISIGGTDVEVTPQQAKDLHEALGELLNVQPKVVEKHVYHERNHYPYWYWPYNTPTWTTGGATTPDRWTINYSATNQSATMSVA